MDEANPKAVASELAASRNEFTVFAAIPLPWLICFSLGG
jgi:hypothetical protein